MTTQTTYSERQQPWVAGFQPNMRSDDNITRTCETVAGIGFGLAVGRGTDAKNGAVLAGALNIFLGVSVRDVTQRIENADKYGRYDGMTIATEGEIIVRVTGTPGPTDPVHYDAATGVFAASAGSGPVRGARWMETSANGLGRLFLSGDGQAA